MWSHFCEIHWNSSCRSKLSSWMRYLRCLCTVMTFEPLGITSDTHQFLDFTLQVVYAVKFPLAAATGCNPVFAPSADVMHNIELLPCEALLLQHLLEVVPAQRHDLIHGERQRHLEWKNGNGSTCLSSTKQICHIPPA